MRLLRPDDGAVSPARGSPRVVEVRRAGGERESGRGFLVDLDAQTRLLARQHVAVLDFGAPHEYRLRVGREAAALMDAEVVVRQLQGQLRGVRERRRVARAVPRRADP